MSHRLYILTGGPGTGKTTVLDLLEQRDYTVVPEVARAIIQEQNASGGCATHTGDQAAFCQLMLEASILEYQKHNPSESPVFFDRGIPDLLGYAEMIGLGDKGDVLKAVDTYRYNPTVFSFPPWEEIYRNDDERSQDFAEAIKTYRHLKEGYECCGYTVLEVPKAAPEERVSYILNQLNAN